MCYGDVALRNADYAIIGALLIVLTLIAYNAVNRLADVSDQTASSALMPGQHECDAGICAIAVLPLTNLSGNPDEEYFADGITEALISRLAGIESLRLISHTTVMQYKTAPKPLPEIARELGIDAVLAGAVLRENGRVRISVQLIQVPIEHHLWIYGRPQDALRYLNAAYAARHLYLLRLNTETDFDAMRVDRKFCDLVTRIGIPSGCSLRTSLERPESPAT